MSGTYEDLTAWQKAMNLTLEVYRVTRAFPKDELYGLTAQLRRAGVSIPSNIAEGKGRDSDKELLRFLTIARGSVYELQTQIVLARNLGYVTDRDMEVLCEGAASVGQLVNALIRAYRTTQAA